MAVKGLSTGIIQHDFKRDFLVGFMLLTGFCLDTVSAQQQSIKEKPLEPFISRMSWIQFEIVNGRIQGRFIRRMQSRTLSLYHPELDAEEHATVRTRGGSFSLKYVFTAAMEGLQVQFDTAGLLQVTYEKQSTEDPGYVVEIRQQGHSDLEIRIVETETTTVYRSAQVWLSMFEMTDLHRSWFIKVLERLSPQLHLELRFSDILGRLSRIAISRHEPDYEVLRALIEQLDSGSFTERQMADRQLRQYGRPLVGFLQGVDYTTLSPEQRTRLKRIAANLVAIEPDTVEQVVSCLRMNPAAWLVLSRRNDPVLTRGALVQLEQLTGQDFGLDRPTPILREPLTAADVRIRLR